MLSRSNLSEFLWPHGLTVACQALLPMEFSNQEYWSGLSFPTLGPGDLPDPGIKPVSPALASGFFTTKPLGKLFNYLGLFQTLKKNQIRHISEICLDNFNYLQVKLFTYPNIVLFGTHYTEKTYFSWNDLCMYILIESTAKICIYIK